MKLSDLIGRIKWGIAASLLTVVAFNPQLVTNTLAAFSPNSQPVAAQPLVTTTTAPVTTTTVDTSIHYQPDTTQAPVKMATTSAPKATTPPTTAAAVVVTPSITVRGVKLDNCPNPSQDGINKINAYMGPVGPDAIRKAVCPS